MPSKNPAQRLRDIIDNIDAIEAFTAQLDFLRHDLAELRGVAAAEFDRWQSAP